MTAVEYRLADQRSVGEAQTDAPPEADLPAPLLRVENLRVSFSDTEVVAHAYEQWGVESLRRLRGMFAFALWDERAQRLLLAVDRFGIKPLYYTVADSELVFGCELVCLLQSERLEKDLDDASLAEYFTLGYVPPPATVFRGARKLEPGTYLEWSPDKAVQTTRYWDVPLPEPAPLERTPEQLRFQLPRQLHLPGPTHRL